MTYLAISDFKHGLNRLRPQVAGIQGSLWNAVNCVISRGGDIESAKKFVPEYALPAGDTFGLSGINGVPYVFGTVSTPGGQPSDIAYEQLTYTGAANLVKVHDARPFSAKMYVIAEFDDGDVRHFYDGVELAEWQTIADAAWSYSTVAKLLARKINARSDVTAIAVGNKVKITAEVSGTPFTLATAVVDTAVVEKQATAIVNITGGTVSAGTNSVDQISLGASDLLASPIDFVTNNTATAAAIAAAITAGAVGGYTATAAGTVVTILAPSGSGATTNGTACVLLTSGDVTGTTTALAGGLTAVTAGLPTAAITHLQTNVAPVVEVRAACTITITGGSNDPGVNYFSQVAIGADNLLAGPVDFVLNFEAMANELALAITSAAVGGYSATAAGAAVTILAPPGLGATVNGTAPAITIAGDVTTTQTSLAGGVTAVAAQTQIDEVTISATTPDTLDSWSVTVNGDTYLSTGRSSATGTLIHVFLERVWVPVGTVLYYCHLSDPTKWSTMAGVPSTDPGFFDTSQDSEGSDDIVSIAEHNDGTAIFSDTNIRIYVLDTDATAIKIFQTIENTGSIAAKVPLQHGSVQIVYLAMSAMSALQSRLGSNFVVTADFATAISPYLQDFIDQVGATVAGNAHAVVEPRDGRYMLSIADKVFVLSLFADSGVAGWTEIDLGFVVEEFARIGRRVYARAGDTIYVYGGVAGDVYPGPNELPLDVELPFLSAQDPADSKNEGGFDMAGTGTWSVELRVDPNDLTKVTKTIYISEVTYPKGTISLAFNTTHVAPHLRCASGGKVTLSNMAIRYSIAETP